MTMMMRREAGTAAGWRACAKRVKGGDQGEKGKGWRPALLAVACGGRSGTCKHWAGHLEYSELAESRSPQAKGSGKGEKGSGGGWPAEWGGGRLLGFWRVRLAVARARWCRRGMRLYGNNGYVLEYRFHLTSALFQSITDVDTVSD
uniref:Uncharacterized protein n=1 Tax=Oryza glaberrima TaxID=4538 RepID=I1QGG1_ORYGL